MKKELLFSITKKDFKIDYFKAPGKGGQKKNKTENACRITHLESKAVGQCSDTRSKMQNKKIAFKRLIDSPKFKAWFQIECAKQLEGKRNFEKRVNKIVDEQMDEKYIKIEHL